MYIQRAFDNNVVDKLFLNYDWVERRMKFGKTKVMADLKGNQSYQLIGNATEEMGWWACFPSTSKKIGRN